MIDNVLIKIYTKIYLKSNLQCSKKIQLKIGKYPLKIISQITKDCEENYL